MNLQELNCGLSPTIFFCASMICRRSLTLVFSQFNLFDGFHPSFAGSIGCCNSAVTGGGGIFTPPSLGVALALVAWLPARVGWVQPIIYLTDAGSQFARFAVKKNAP